MMILPSVMNDDVTPNVLVNGGLLRKENVARRFRPVRST
jgi:hypothetical protein